jgi:hypothetical protein
MLKSRNDRSILEVANDLLLATLLEIEAKGNVEIINTTESEVLYNRSILLQPLRSIIKDCHAQTEAVTLVSTAGVNPLPDLLGE